MASLNDMIAELEGLIAALDTARAASAGSESSTDEMIQQAEAIGLEGLSEALLSVKSQLETMTSGVDNLKQSTEDLIQQVEGLKQGGG
ncbi:hypothetical protein [Kineosporia sp. NBRC 101731]|uniref:hypothetical protein n=1 Tax=Kineosporia sp. NBRC 101731 TaxID=3032199 RepID=UPI0024A42A9C|nr:hypothetical protein [Kineosporia sp. NBRC 101731]GLY29859.1 hypothetical protein Kisp02_32240 [Kineosporia sp. NBRC 101731]